MVQKLGVVLEPTKKSFEKEAVLNPACYQEGENIHLFYRAIDGHFKSSIGYAKLRGPMNVVERWNKPIIEREFPYEKKGVEDPRIAKVGRTYYMTYVAHDGKNAVTAYAKSKDLVNFEKRGVISPKIAYADADKIFQHPEFGGGRLKDAYSLFASYYRESAGEDVLIWHKDSILFPKKINGQFAMLNRILPDMQIVFFKSFSNLKKSFWENYISQLSKYVVLENKHWFETRNIGGGCTPIETPKGWLVIYHAVEELNKGRRYHAGAALLHKKDPLRVVGKLHEPLFSPEESWEISGDVSNVVFPTGTAIFGDTLYIYYGAADTRIAVASVNLPELLTALTDSSLSHHG
ncbi:MAG: pesticidal protein Cry7Aa [Candidatus Harrisonbacteria bacterium CG10_big_fil_rev_8_21_14_0_10_40_38]|uniref:Pesticidal protein Cry7Aa n=1 Tax=Candidatus Harrisonbacteria bacterium CG10_big_fil_rev_8_21_14_0_10_40_38 TaxID=1974583 RepID=A0A2H0UTB4_9BACT|nr:MAG: pesticidal protein Cry7Aa [Candidatus Harrisonbacteria bacterium CG10_big_fil_rev_8_21_14_0_10_40_38]